VAVPTPDKMGELVGTSGEKIVVMLGLPSKIGMDWQT
jgi:hypothetical protein